MQNRQKRQYRTGGNSVYGQCVQLVFKELVSPLFRSLLSSLSPFIPLFFSASFSSPRNCVLNFIFLSLILRTKWRNIAGRRLLAFARISFMIRRNMIRQIDLHIHSTCSDGTLSPTELVGYAARGSNFPPSFTAAIFTFSAWRWTAKIPVSERKFSGYRPSGGEGTNWWSTGWLPTASIFPPDRWRKHTATGFGPERTLPDTWQTTDM